MAVNTSRENMVFIDKISCIEKNLYAITSSLKNKEILPVATSGKTVSKSVFIVKCSMLSDFFSDKKIQKILIRKGAFSTKKLNQIVNQCRNSQIAPLFVTIKETGISIENIHIQDLLAHNRFYPKNTSIIHKAFFQKTVLITGAAGSVGSELLRQTAACQPKKIVALDKDFKRLSLLEKNMRKNLGSAHLDFIHADITDKQQLESVFQECHFDFVLHSAAFKYVPEAESNSSDTVLTNTFGTILLAEIARKYNCEVFVNISTDKAVNPSGVMGQSKRYAELFLLNKINSKSPTRFIITRFGNIIASRGSVIPVFEQQIRKNLPLTVTHPAMKRFFMSVEQAAEMVLFTAATGNHGDLFIYDMGHPHLIKNLAEKIIFLSGKKITPLSIVYSGIRPGEKLSEQLYESDARVFPSGHKKILRILEHSHSTAKLDLLLENLQQFCIQKQNKKVAEILSKINSINE